MTRRAGVAALALLPAALLLAAAVLQMPDLPQTFPDSNGYLQWQPARPLGYPLLLSAVRALDPSLRVLPAVQLGLFSVGVLLLAEACRYATGSLPLALFVGGGTLANLALVRLSLGVLADGPFCTLLMLHLASFLALLRHPTPARWLALSLTLGAAVLVRPAGLSLLAPLALVLLPRPRQAWLLALGPAVALWLCAAGVNLAWRGSFALQEFGGLSMIGHVASLIDGHAPSKHPVLVKRLAEDLRPWRDAAGERRWPEESVLFSAVEWNPMFGVASRRIAEYLDERGAPALGLSGLPRPTALNRIAADVSRETILARPAVYLAHVAAHLYGLWTIPQWKSAEELAGIESQFDPLYPGARGLPGHKERYLGFLSARSRLFLLVKRVVLAGIFTSTTLGLLMPLLRSRPADAAAHAWLFASISVHAALLLVAAANAALWRYSIVWWPYALLAGGLALRPLLAGGLARIARPRRA